LSANIQPPGGANPAIRTLFYRLVRLLGHAIHPIFVFDGPNKPAFKRNKRSSGKGDTVATSMAKHLIRHFGFAMHDAPGEAEAECALLEQQGIVDAVLSEDVDTIMFGCRKTLRNWSSEGTKGSKTPTHVSMYDAAAVAAGASKLDREGMVLVALMSGGDYLPEGVPGCGVKVACEAARGGFGRDLCRIKRADRDGLAAWKARLLHELRTNESGVFRTRHKALEIPESFPNMEILRYYTHPVVSKEATVERLRKEFPPASTVDVVGLREFTRETFDWEFKNGAIKLIRVLAPSLLVQQFLDRSESTEEHDDDLDMKQEKESALVKAISSKRAHFSTDATPELRVSFIPAGIVKLDLDKEPEEEEGEGFGRSGIALNSDDDFDEEPGDGLGSEQPKSSVRKPFDPFQPELVWVPATLAKLGIPLTVEDWEGRQRMKEQRVATKGTRKPRAKKTDMPMGALDKYVKVTKSVAGGTGKDAPRPEYTSSPPRTSGQRNPPVPAPTGRGAQSKKTSTSSQAKTLATINPWTLANSQASPRGTKPSSAQEAILISSSPVAPASPEASGASLRSIQTTPTRAKRVSSPMTGDIHSPGSLFGSSPSPSHPQFQVFEEPAEKRQPTATTQLTRKTRPFKKVKSGANGSANTSTQRSIKAFGQVLKNVGSSQVSSKPDACDKEPIEILSDDDDDIPLPPLKQPPASIFGRNAPCTNSSFGLVSDDDPFASPPPPRRTVSPCSPPIRTNAPASSAQRKSGPHTQLETKGVDVVKDDTAGTTTTTTARNASTELYIIDTSLKGTAYFGTLEVDRDDADRVKAAHNAPRQGKPPSRRAWRRSEIPVLDLTGED
jgi:Holliday junction resolvase YEN1